MRKTTGRTGLLARTSGATPRLAAKIPVRPQLFLDGIAFQTATLPAGAPVRASMEHTLAALRAQGGDQL